MKYQVWKKGMTAEEEANVGYWERNMLALHFAITTNQMCRSAGLEPTCGWYKDTDNNWDGWLRVISLMNGKMCFHIPDDFDLGDLPEIEPNWNGHSTEDKWEYSMWYCGCKIDK
ncbi:hypothetical protein [Bacillus phage Nachito]|nr:hypothetical protein [Bacillus phage Nachito]